MSPRRSVRVSEEKKSKVEAIKEKSDYLRGNISETLKGDDSHFTEEDYQLLKFHGIYQQDDRDVRQQLKKEGKERKYMFMVRTKNPGGGELSPQQWEALCEAGEKYANGTLRITTRQTIQFHGIGKDNLKNAMRYLNENFVPTNGACGDVNRNTMAGPVSDITGSGAFNAQELAREISENLSFKTTAYYDVWMDGEMMTKDEPPPSNEIEPMYGKAYLPRKFKIGIAEEHDNSVDVHTNDIGVVPVINGELKGFNILVGGGLGSHHRQKRTFPRLADPLGFVSEDKVHDTLKAILEFQRDNGDRTDRKHARMKYVVEEWGIDKVRSEIEKRVGFKFEPVTEFTLRQPENHLGWHTQSDPELMYVGIFVENGRIKDTSGNRTKTCIREIVKEYGAGVRLTALQNIILSGIPKNKKDEISARLESAGVKTEDEYSKIRLNSMACPALPTCGLALAEAERYMPDLISELEKMGYGDENIKIRMSGCPNSCSRPPTSEIGLIGASPGKYNIYLGGNFEGTRMNTLYEEMVSESELAPKIAEFIDFYRENGKDGEAFGDFCARVGFDEIRKSTRPEGVEPPTS